MTDCALLERGLLSIISEIPPQAVDRLLRFSALLLEKNKVMNLTAVTNPTEVITRHFLDCAILAPFVLKGESVLDVGTGAGFPGLPLAILTGGQFTLLDAQRKRIDFLTDVIAELGLQNVTALHARAEDFAKEKRGRFDMATSRAVAELNVLYELSLPMLRVGGRFLAMKAVDCGEEVARASNAAAVLGGAPAVVRQYTVPESGVERALVVVEKRREGPVCYPRRFAKISAQPL